MACYARYLTGQFAFRRAIERVLADGPAPADGWSIAPLADALRRDVADLALPHSTVPQWPDKLSAALAEGGRPGALYVVEGSSLGARLLQKQAAMLGLSDEFGARHLALQTSEPARWRSFVDFLDRSDPRALDASVRAAAATFELAQHCFSGRP